LSCQKWKKYIFSFKNYIKSIEKVILILFFSLNSCIIQTLVDFPAKLEIKRTSNLETYLHTLHKASNYSIRVLAYTATGDGLASHPLFCQTDDDVPDAPAAIKAAALTADSILISWLTPKNRNGIISHYTVYSREAGRKGQAKSEYQRNGAQRGAVKSIRPFNFFRMVQLTWCVSTRTGIR